MDIMERSSMLITLGVKGLIAAHQQGSSISLFFLILGVIILSAVPGHNWSHSWKSCGWMGN